MNHRRMATLVMETVLFASAADLLGNTTAVAYLTPPPAIMHHVLVVVTHVDAAKWPAQIATDAHSCRMFNVLHANG